MHRIDQRLGCGPLKVFLNKDGSGIDQQLDIGKVLGYPANKIFRILEIDEVAGVTLTSHPGFLNLVKGFIWV